MYDTSKLRGRIVEKYGTLSAFAEEVHCSLSYLSQYINGKKKLNQPTMEKWAEALDIQGEEMHIYFFTRKVHE